MNLPAHLKEAIAYLDEWFGCQKVNDKLTPGYSVAISYKGGIVYKKAFGFANMENGERMTSDHLFRIASHSKTFTSLAIMQLMEVGKLNIYDPAAKYLPFLKENPDPRLSQITIQQMLSHSSGMVRDSVDTSFWRLEKAFPSKEEMTEECRTHALILNSNTRFKYSNYAYGLLGWIIEDVSGMSYSEYMGRFIFEPLGLSGIGTEYDPKDGPYVTGYTLIPPHGGQVPIRSSVHTEGIFGAAGFYSKAENLCRFYSAVMPGSGELLSDNLKREMLRQQWPIPGDGDDKGYALGFSCVKHGNRFLNGHTGGMPGHSTKTLFDKEEGIVVSILANSQGFVPDSLQKGAWHIIDFIKQHYREKSRHRKYRGQFYELWGIYNFIPLGDKVFVSWPSETEPFSDCSELEHVEGNVFRISKESGSGCFGENVEFIMEGDTVRAQPETN